VVARALAAGVAQPISPDQPRLPRNWWNGRAVDFAVPATIFLGLLAVRRLRSAPSGPARVVLPCLVGLGLAVALATVPEGYYAASLALQNAPFQLGMTLPVWLSRLSPSAPWILAAGLVLASALLVAPRDRRFRRGRIVGAAIVATALAAVAVAIAGEISIQSRGSLLYHSAAARAVEAARDEIRLEAVEVVAPSAAPSDASAQGWTVWKDQLRVLADHPRLALAAPAADVACRGRLTREPDAGRRELASFHDGALRLYAPDERRCPGSSPPD
jgi:hypothetical protein